MYGDVERCKFRERAVACLKGKLFVSGMWKHCEGCTVTRNESPFLISFDFRSDSKYEGWFCKVLLGTSYWRNVRL